MPSYKICMSWSLTACFIVLMNIASGTTYISDTYVNTTGTLNATLGIQTLGNATASYFIGSGKYLSDVNYTDSWSANQSNYYNISQSNANYLLKTGDTATGNYTFDSGTLFIDSVQNRVGIANANPANALDVGSTAAGGNAFIHSTLAAELAPPLATANWTLQSGWQYLTSPDRIDKYDNITFGFGYAYFTSTLVVGTVYKVTFTVDSFSGSGCTWVVGGVYGQTITAPGTYTYYVTAISTQTLIFAPASATRMTISYVSVRALTPGTGDLTVEGNLALYKPILSTLDIGTTSMNGAFIRVYGSSTDTTYDVFSGQKKYPRFSLIDSAAGGSTFYFWNLGNQMRFGTDPGNSWSSAFIVDAGIIGTSHFNGDLDLGAFNSTATGPRNQKIIGDRVSASFTTAGTLTLQASGAGAGSTNISGGALILSSGISTGTGSSYIGFNTATDGASGTTDRTPTEKMRITGAGNIGINTTAPSYPLTVYALNTSDNISIWSLGNISAAGYITRTTVYDKSEGAALVQIKDASAYLSNGAVNHSAFGYSYVSYNGTVVERMDSYNKTVEVCEPVRTCEYSDKPGITNEVCTEKQVCRNETQAVYLPVYKTVKEEGVSLDKEVALLKQAIYELKEENIGIREELCETGKFSWCV